MESKDRLIYANEVIEEIDEIIGNINFSSPYQNDIPLIVDGLERARDCVLDACTVDAVPVDEIKLHHIIIDNEGVPEVKLQIGDRYFILRTDPVDVREVVHGRWEHDCVEGCNPFVDSLPIWVDVMQCSVCKEYIEGSHGTNYCPNCGAKMDGEQNG